MTVRVVAMISAGAALFVGCRGDVYILEAQLVDGILGGLGCEANRAGIESIHVQVLRWEGWDGQEELAAECVTATTENGVREIESPEDLISWFDRRGYIARSIPTDEVSIVRIRGYPVGRCPIDDVEPIFCAMPALHNEGAEAQPQVLSEELTSEAEPIPLTVVCHPELLPGPPSVCSNSVSVRCGDNVCGFTESTPDCEADCGPMPDLCRWYRACSYFRRPG